MAEVIPTIFHSYCSFCGSNGRETSLIDFVNSWHNTSIAKMDNLFHLFKIVIKNSLVNYSWYITHKIPPYLKQELVLINQIIDNPDDDTYNQLFISKRGKVYTNFECPFCGLGKGSIVEKVNFDTQYNAIIDQVADLLHSMGIVINALINKCPKELLNKIEELKQLLNNNQKALNATELLKCHICGKRVSSVLGDGSRGNPIRCHDCFELGGGMHFEININEIFEGKLQKKEKYMPYYGDLVPFLTKNKYVID